MSLGDTLPKHRKALADAKHQTERFIASAEAAVKRGDCREAFTSVARAASSFGATVVHNKAVRGDVSGLNMLDNRYWAARNAFRDVCVITQPLGRARRRKAR